jgi:RNA polymerase sigma-70 factor (ECF subfamily)
MQQADQGDLPRPQQLSLGLRVEEGTMSLASKVHLMSSPVEVEPEIGWMSRIRDGDMDAFRLLVEAHQARVIGIISKMLGSDSEAEDLAQQVFIRVWKSASRYKPTAKFTTWLFRIARNLVFNEIRRRRHAGGRMEDAPEQAERSEREPDQVLLESELQEAIQQAIDQLPETQRLAIVLRRFEEMPYEEIAEVMDTTVPAVKSILFRARTELREKLARYLG